MAIVLRRILGDEEQVHYGPHDKRIFHDLPPVSSAEVTGIPLTEAPGASSIQNDDRFVSIAEFATVEAQEPTTFHTVNKRDSITFLLLFRQEGARGKRKWDFPTIGLCQEFINDLLCKLYASDISSNGATSYSRSGKWGRLQTIVLSSHVIEAMNEFRRQIVLNSYKGFSFDTFPRDVVVAKADVSILFRASMKTFQNELIPKVLFTRNADVIAGTLRVLSSTFFGPEEKSHKGESKAEWRTVSLKGDDQFMRCLRFIPENRPFLLGYDSVQIRGGLRPIEMIQPQYQPGSKRPWSEIAPSATPLLMDPRLPSLSPDPGAPMVSEDTPRHGLSRGRASRGGRSRGRGRGRFQRGR